MYGIITAVMEELVTEKFGIDVWHDIKNKAGCGALPDGGFIRHEYYTDEVFSRLLKAACMVSGLESSAIVAAFGEFFVQWVFRTGYGSILKSQGSTMLEVLNGLDEMHAGLRLGMPKMVSPRFICTEDTSSPSGALILDYSSHREGLSPMLLGMVPALGKALFAQTFSCVQLEQWPTPDKMICTRFRIECLGDSKPDSSLYSAYTLMQRVSRIFKRGDEAAGYAFFAHNPSMVHGWVEALQHKVAAIEAPSQVDRFASSFDLRHLASLLVTPSPVAREALSLLFLKPFTTGGLLPVPSLGYARGPHGVQGLRTAMYPSMVMTGAVTSGDNALVQTSAQPGYRLTNLQILACVVPCPLADSILLRALADTPNEDLLESLETWCLLTAAWVRVRPRFILNLFSKACVLTLITCLLLELRIGKLNFCREHLALKCFFAKEALEAVAICVGHLSRGWFSEYFGIDTFFDWMSLTFYGYFLWSYDDRECSVAIHKGVPSALFVCDRWWQLLIESRGLVGFGPTILPIVYTLSSITNFLIMMSVVLLGFLYSYAILDHRPLGLHTLDLILNELFSLNASPDMDEPGVRLWHYTFLFALTLLLLNLLIGVLSEKYVSYQESATALFSRQRARLILKLEMCLYPRYRFFKCLRFMQALVSMECPANPCMYRCRHPCLAKSYERLPEEDAPNGTELGSPYLWLCAPQHNHQLSPSRSENRKSYFKQFSAESLTQLVEAAVERRVGEKIQSFELRLQRMGRRSI